MADDIFDQDRKTLAKVRARDKGNSDNTGRSRIAGSDSDESGKVETADNRDKRFGTGQVSRAAGAVEARNAANEEAAKEASAYLGRTAQTKD